jgi:hypothetical protein
MTDDNVEAEEMRLQFLEFDRAAQKCEAPENL